MTRLFQRAAEKCLTLAAVIDRCCMHILDHHVDL